MSGSSAPGADPRVGADGVEASFQDLIAAWDGQSVVIRRDPPTDTWIFIALHDDTLGTPVGGCRMKVYERPADGLRDALRLARGMTYKWAALELPFGGGKSVLAVPRKMEGEEREALFRRFGGFLNSLKGIYGAGEDLGTTPEDMAVLARETRYVAGGDPATGHPTDPGPFTALGVLSGIRSALDHRTGDGGLEGRSVHVQGVGDVGLPLARMLAEAGARLSLTDVDEERAGEVARELGARVVAPRDVYRVECDVFAPCAVGGILNRVTIPDLRCRIVAGSANNQLEAPEDAERLRSRGILYAPDYIINAGGAMAFGLFSLGEDDLDEVRRRIVGIGDTLDAIFEEAADREVSPLSAATERVQEILERAREEGPPRGRVSLR